ncbi:probable G-protein coupled receptor B0563.6 [Dreissena polymorpha]|uniref:probable G-protein coupled receptor B0563.6 n=1 Tax=Dreissena polymorpha TaxID=45954 RepID=UPI002263C2D7|nr:probable G-protein coupled receptor B0563.6 [Dreissena polymorpha]
MNASNTSNAGGDLSAASHILTVYKLLYEYVLPLIVFVGLIGNLTSIYLLQLDKQMRKVSSSVFLTSVLVSDTGMLMSLLLVWIESLGYPVNHLPAVCRINVYLTYVFGFLSIWYVVCISVETFITICHPTRIKQMCTLFRARAVAVMLLAFALVLYVVAPFITEVQSVPHSNTTKNCLPIAQYAHLLQLLFYVDLVLTLLLPFVLLIILLTFMTVAIVRSIQRKQQRNNRKTNEEYHTSRIRKLPQVRVAKMLFILSVSVVFLNIPSHGFKLKSLISGNAILSETESLIHLLLLFLSYTSFSVKFFICVACSKNFRKLIDQHCVFGKTTRYQTVAQQTMETAT